MKKRNFGIAMAIPALLLALGCSKQEETPTPVLTDVSIQFESTQLAIQEGQETRTIKLSFDRPARKDGAVRLSLSAGTAGRIITEPALVNGVINLSIAKDQASAVVVLQAVNNATCAGNEELQWTLSGPSDGFVVGKNKSLSVALIDDDCPVTTPLESVADFVPAEGVLSETDHAGKTFAIQLSRALEAAGAIELSVASSKAVYGTHYVSVPEMINGKITLNPALGAEAAQVLIKPVNNSVITGDLDLSITIANTTGAIRKGTVLSQAVRIADDELANLPKGYEIAGGSWSLKKVYEYDEAGRISRVHVEQATPARITRTETYFYDAQGRIEKINLYPDIDQVFTWSENRITKSKKVDKGVVKEYTEYDYDAQGNVSGTANYYRQPDGQYKLGFLIGYLYFPDGNLYKSLTYAPAADSKEYILLSTKTWDGYIQADNPFPMVEILPGMKTQNKLPSSYRLEENGVNLLYNFSYEFRADGRVSKRTTSGAQTSETASYHYY